MVRSRMMSKIIKILILLLLIVVSMFFVACDSNTSKENEEIIQNVSASQNANPLLPGYFADPSVCKFGDTYYIYATTGGLEFNGGPLSTPCVWKSEDFSNWSATEIELKNKNGSKYTFGSYWAPSVMEHNGRYYLVFTLNDHDTIMAESDSPEGPFTIMGNIYEKTTWKTYKTIDAQFFKDEDGEIYISHLVNKNPAKPENNLYTGISRLNSDDLMKVEENLLLEELDHMYREGQEIIKRDGKYYMLYSTGTWTGEEYVVRYATSENIMGPYTDKGPILESARITDEREIDVRGPGHCSVLNENGKYYIVYHRHFNPFISFNYRQVCANELKFTEDGEIEKVNPDHKVGAGKLGEDSKYSGLKNVALDSEVTTDIVSRYYELKSLTDENNGTIWKCTVQQLPKPIVIDLKESYDVKFTQIFFEYTVKYYRYTLEYSENGENWEMYADRSKNTQTGLPMEDSMEVKARYFRLTLEEPQKMTGAYKVGGESNDIKTIDRDMPYCGIFEFKIFAETK